MIIVFLILLVIVSSALGFIVLVQNPKGGGLSGNVGGFSNQLMGVKQTTDVLEKGTWIFAAAVGLLALFSTMFLKNGTTSVDDTLLKKVNTNQTAPAAAPAAAPANTTTLPTGKDTTKK